MFEPVPCKGDRVIHKPSGKTGIVTEVVEGAPTVHVVPDDRPERSVCWYRCDLAFTE